MTTISINILFRTFIRVYFLICPTGGFISGLSRNLGKMGTTSWKKSPGHDSLLWWVHYHCTCFSQMFVVTLRDIYCKFNIATIRAEMFNLLINYLILRKLIWNYSDSYFSNKDATHLFVPALQMLGVAAYLCLYMTANKIYLTAVSTTQAFWRSKWPCKWVD